MLMRFPLERPTYPARPSGALRAEVKLSEGRTWLTATTVIAEGERRCSGLARVRRTELTEPLNAERLRQRIVKLSFYRASLRFLGDRPVWGSLSGIRPAILMRRLMDEGLDDRQALRRFAELYDVAPARAALTLDAARAAKAAISRMIFFIIQSRKWWDLRSTADSGCPSDARFPYWERK